MYHDNSTQTAAVAPAPIWVRLTALQRMAIALTAAMLVAFATYSIIDPMLHVLVCWNVAVWSYVVLSSMLIFRTAGPNALRESASQRVSTGTIVTIVLLAAASSIATLVYLHLDTSEFELGLRLWLVALSVAALFGSWTLIHVMFTFVYANSYYRSRSENTGKLGSGLQFPGEPEPCYLEFCYYAFAVGMSTATPDVVVLTRQMRSITLLHGIVSFAFNIAVVGLSMNLVANVI